MKLAVVIWQDRHTDTTVHPFTEGAKAIEWARAKAIEYGTPADIKEHRLTAEMKRDGWLYYVEYSCESDHLRVVEVEVDKP